MGRKEDTMVWSTRIQQSHNHLLILALPALMFISAYASTAETVGRWRFEGKAGSGAKDDALATTANKKAFPAKPNGQDGKLPSLSNLVPAPFVYDPITGRSEKNTTSISIKASKEKSGYVTVGFDPQSDAVKGLTSFTIEAFVKPTADPGVTFAAVMKSRKGDSATAWRLGGRHLSRWRQTYYGATFDAPGEKTVEMSTGYYTGISRIHKKTLDWRHIALVYDAEKKTITCYTDYWCTRTAKTKKPVTWDAGPLYIGGEPGKGGMAGLIDEVRLTKGVLKPSQFLRATKEALEGVSYESTEAVLPRGTGYIDLKEGFGAVGDGKTDDTPAFQRAFRDLANKIPLAYNTLYIPPGTYLISDHCRWTRFMIVQGAGSDKVTIKLKDNCSGYGDPKKPKPILGMGWSAWGKWGRGAGNVIANYLFGVTIDAGKGNPGAVGLDHHSNNWGAVEDVVIRSGDGKGHIGLSFMRPWPGPSLMKNMRIIGFDYGMKINCQEYSMTLEHVRFENQNKAAIYNTGNIIALRKITSVNKVPAIVNAYGNGMVTVLDSEFTGGSPDAYAIKNNGGLYARNIKTAGYKAAIHEVWLEGKGKNKKNRKKKERVIEGPDVSEHIIQDRVVTLFDSPKTALKLPVEETPDVPWGDIKKDWVSIDQFANKARGGGKDRDWAPAVQAAIDSGAKTIYFPHSCALHSPIHLRGPVERLFGMRNKLGRKKGDKGTTPIVIYDHPDPKKVVVVERLGIEGLKHASPGTLVVKHGGLAPYTNAKGCGKLFMENSVSNGYVFEHPQKVWVRQWNVEQHGAGPGIISKGATIWSLGFKTEYESSKLWASNGAKTEILGAFIYPIGKIPKDRPIFKNTDSRMSVVYGTSVYRANHSIHIIDTQKGVTKHVTNEHLLWAGSRARMDLYVSNPKQP